MKSASKLRINTSQGFYWLVRFADLNANDYAGVEKSSRWNSVGPIKKREHLILRGSKIDELNSVPACVQISGELA